MAELIRTMNCAIKIEKVKDVIEINIASAAKPIRTSRNAKLYYPVKKLDGKNLNLLCKSISSVFPIGHAGEVKLTNGLLALLKGE